MSLIKPFFGMFGLLLLGSLICLVSGQSFPANLTVAQDGTGQFHTIQEAVEAAPSNSQDRFYIKIKSGTYREIVRIGVEKPWLALIGDGIGKTLIVGNRSVRGGFRTFDTATVGISGPHFLAIDLTFKNEAGPESMQAVAMKSEVEATFYRCSFIGYQDTLYAYRGKQFYRECDIYGTVDFIFGDAAALFQKCRIFAQKPLQGQYITITAQGRDIADEAVGIVLHNSYISATADFKKLGNTTKMFLGRNWGPYALVVIMQSNIDGIVDPQGWIKWDNQTNTDLLYFGEYGNRGIGAAVTQRPMWVKRLHTPQEAAPFTLRNFNQGNEWIPKEVPFDLDLI